jgi:hypothetical protein
LSNVDTIISQALAIANDQSSQVTEATNLALGIAGGATFLGSATAPAMPDPKTPDATNLHDGRGIGVYIPQSIDPTAVFNSFQSTYNDLLNVAINGIADYLTTYFPRTTSWDEAQSWLETTIGLNGANYSSVENNLWANSRNRIMADELRQENAVYARFARAGFPVYPGSSEAAIRELQIQRSDKLAEVSNTAAIKHLDISIDLIKFAVHEAIDLRLKAMETSIAYIRALLEPADVASRFVFQLQGMQAQLISAVGGYYDALLAKDKILLDAAQFTAEWNLKYLGLATDLTKVDIAARTKAAVGAAAASAKSAAGALSAVNAIGSQTEAL